MPIAYSYKRVSSKPQTKGHGPQRQQDAAEKYAAEHGLELDDSYHDLGVSGYRGKNVEEGALGAFLDEVKAGRIPRGSYLLVENLDRLSRDKVRKALPVFLQIINAGIKIVTLLDNPPQVYSAEKIDEDNGMSLFASLMIMVRAHDESLRKGQRVKNAWDKKREEGTPMTAICPKWLRLSEDRTRYIQIPEKVAIVQRLFQMSIGGVGVHSIAKQFNEEGVPPLGDATAWEGTTVARILHNKAVIGTLVSPRTGEVTEGYYPAIIDVDDFNRVQLAIKTRNAQGAGRKGTSVTNLFSGMFRCAKCGSRMRYTSKGDNGYVHCLASYESAKKCDAPRLNYAPIEFGILTTIFALERAPIVDGPTSIDPMSSYRLELADLHARMDAYLNEFEEANFVFKRIVKGRIERLAAQIEELENKIKTHVPAPPVASSYARAKALYDEHEDLCVRAERGEDVQNELRDVRLRLQTALQSVIERIKLDPWILKRLDSDGNPTYSRKCFLYGPIQQLADESENALGLAMRDKEGGVVVSYFLPTWGVNNTGREAEWKKQLENMTQMPEGQDLVSPEELLLYVEHTKRTFEEISALPKEELTPEIMEYVRETLRLFAFVENAQEAQQDMEHRRKA